MAVRLCILFVQIMLEIAVSHWPFSNQFLDLADQNRYVRTNLLSSEMFLFSINGRPISNAISSTDHRKMLNILIEQSYGQHTWVQVGEGPFVLFVSMACTHILSS